MANVPLGPAPPPAEPELPPLPAIHPSESAAFAAMLGLVRRLRGPGGCPWDQEQTPRTLTPYLVEEAYEVIDAIERDDAAAISEELGDLVFLLLFCIEMGREAGGSGVDDVLLQHVRKMMGRHPHVFGGSDPIGAGDAARQWEELKQVEPGPGKDRRSVVAGRLKSLPALTAAYRVQEKAAAVGFDWAEVAGALDKLEEEIAELRSAIAEAPADASRREELGDLLFALVNVARRLRIDPEAALRGSTAKFIRRFQYIEDRLEAAGTRPATTPLAEMDRLWEEAKAREAGPPDPESR
jgi:MazG family protein